MTDTPRRLAEAFDVITGGTVIEPAANGWVVTSVTAKEDGGGTYLVRTLCASFPELIGTVVSAIEDHHMELEEQEDAKVGLPPGWKLGMHPEKS